MFALGPWFFACWWEILLSFFWSRNFFSIFASESRHFVFSSIFAQKSTSNRFLGSYVCSRTVIFCMLMGNFIIFLLKQKLFFDFCFWEPPFCFFFDFCPKVNFKSISREYVCSRTVIFCMLVGNFIIFLLKQKLFFDFCFWEPPFCFFLIFPP